MAQTLQMTIWMLLAAGASGEGSVTLKHGSIEAVVPANATRSQRHQALLEAFSVQEEKLANTFTNAISTHQWSLMAEEFGQMMDSKPDAPKIEAWYINDRQHGAHASGAVARAHCMEKQLKKAGIPAMRFEGVGHSKQALAECTKNGIAEEELANLKGGKGHRPEHLRHQQLMNWCSKKHLLEALEQAEGSQDVDYFLVLEDNAAIHESNLKPMLESLVHDLSDPRIAGFANVKGFDFIQLDPYGGVGNPVGFLQGRPLYKPSEDMKGAAEGAYQGSHAYLLKRSALHKITKYMEQNKATRFELLPQRIPEFIAVAAGATTNKESPMFHASTASKSCQAPKPAQMDKLGEDTKKAWWFPKAEPSKASLAEDSSEFEEPKEDEDAVKQPRSAFRK